MINLLPENEKKELRLEQIWKQLTVALSLFLLFFLIFIGFLYFINFYISQQLLAVKRDISNAQREINGTEYRNFEATVLTTNRNLGNINNFYRSQISVIDFFNKLTPLIPDAVYFTNISISKSSVVLNGKRIAALDVKLTGRAKDREQVYLFFNNLKKEKTFKSFYFSPQSWVQPKDVKFSLEIKFTPQK